MKKCLCLMVCSLFAVNIFSQTSPISASFSPVIAAVKSADALHPIRAGIQWVEGLSWEAIKAKAKREGKYIFLDCFTTWCGPCRTMDGEVYANETVGNFFNQHFLSVKVQMDKTKKDDEQVKRWYNDADSIGRQFHVTEYPTFIFLSPEGGIVDHQMGFKQAKEFIAIADNAIKPGRNYKDPYQEYAELITAYKKGERNYSKYPLMIQIAGNQRDNIGNQLTRELIQYMSTLKREERYTKERMEAINQRGRIWASSTHVYSFYYNDGNMIDKVMGEPGYSKNRIDETIQAEIVTPFFNEQNKNPNISMSGMYKMYLGASPPADTSEADWGKLEKKIREKYNADYTARNILIARLEWYARHRNVQQHMRYGLVRLNKYPPDPKSISDCSMTNGLGWDAFLHSTDKRTLKGYARHIGNIVKAWLANPKPMWTDTYANLLYKLGKKKAALYWEQQAAELNGDEYSRVAAQMKKSEPTYLNQGAVWQN